MTTIETLETFVDENGLLVVVEALIEICNGKADHLATYWQDHRHEKIWLERMAVLQRAVAGLKKLS